MGLYSIIFSQPPIIPNILGDSRVDMRGMAYEAVFIYCECAITKQIGLPVG